MRIMHLGPVWQANRRERVQRRRTNWSASSAVLAAALLGCVLPQAASAAGGFAQSKTQQPFTACRDLASGDPTCEAIAVPTVATSSGEAVGPEFQGSGELGGFDPKDLLEIYKLPDTGGSGQTVAIVDPDNDLDAESDLKKYRDTYALPSGKHLPECTEANGCFKKIDTNGETEKEAKEHEKPFPENELDAGETSLDLDMVSAACSECHILLVETPSKEPETNTEFATLMLAGVEEAYSYNKHEATEISNSWDIWEGEFTEGEQKANDAKYLDHPGVPITFASGDYGYYTGKLRWPGSSRDVISVGATRVKKIEPKPKEGEREWTEEPWREYEKESGKRTYVGVTHGAGTTSGCSKYESKPEWQKDKEGCEHRTDVDVAVVGACDSPVSMYDTYYGGWFNDCGTSDAAPFIAGVEALSTPHSRNLGAQAFYVAGENKSLYDITKGGNGECGDLTGEKFTECNAKYGYESLEECGAPKTLHYYLCHALEGYDAPVGWGAPDGPVASGPAVTTEAATSVSKTGASLDGMVNPEGGETKYYFEYDTKEYKLEEGAHGTKTSEASAGAGTSNVKEGKTITGLVANTKYDFRIVAKNSTGMTYGLNQTFTTLPNAPENITPPVASPETPDQAVPESTTTGTWTNEATSYTYQWERCNSTGSECAELAGATGSKYTPVEADVKHTLVAKACAKNSGGQACALSKATKQIEAIGGITTFGSFPENTYPADITAGPDGNLWFTEEGSGKIVKLTTSGTMTEYSLPAGSKPWGITAGPAKEQALWFTEGGTDKIGKITTSGTITEYVRSGGGYLHQIATGPDGNLWFTSSSEGGSSEIGKITTSGTITEYSLAIYSSPDDITAGPDGNLWFAGWNKIDKITTSGTVTEYRLPNNSEPTGIISGPDGNLWFTDFFTGKIGKITTSGTVTEYALPSGSEPENIAAGADSNLWFTEYGTSKIGRITTSGTVTEYALSQHPWGIAAGPDDNLWFTAQTEVGNIAP
jgi:virginiamycin B lyase